MIKRVLLLSALMGSSLQSQDFATLEYYLSKSPLVVAATVTKPPGEVSFSAAHYDTVIHVDDVLHGELNEKTLIVTVTRLRQTGGVPEEGSRYILFLKERPKNRGWETSDFWFGIQPYFSGTARAIRDVSVRMREEARWRPLRNIKHPPTMTDFPMLAGLARGEDKEVALEALSTISSMRTNETVAEFLNEMMKSDNREIAFKAAIVSCYSGDWSGFETLLDAVDDQDPELRKKAVAQLGDFQFVRHQDRIVNALLERSKHESDEAILERVVGSLGSYPSERVLNRLRDFEEHENEQIRRRAKRAKQLNRYLRKVRDND